MEMVDFVIYAVDTRPESKTRGREIPGSLVRLMRFPTELEVRATGRCSGPWQNIRGGLCSMYRWVETGGSKTRVPRKVLEPVSMELVTNSASRETSLVPMTLTTDSYPTKAEATSGTIIGTSGKFVPFSEDNAKYLESCCLFHYRHGSLSFMDDETADAVYATELPKLYNLVGKMVFWEFRPYVKTVAGGSSGVDDFKMAIADAATETVAEKAR